MITDQKTTSKTKLWISYVLQALIIGPFVFGAFGNIMQSDSAVEMATDMGYPAESVMYLGFILLTAAVLYAIPKTCILGAMLVTGWLGGAVATHIIHGDPVGQMVFPVVFGVIVWFALWLRMPNLRAVAPLVNN